MVLPTTHRVSGRGWRVLWLVGLIAAGTALAVSSASRRPWQRVSVGQPASAASNAARRPTPARPRLHQPGAKLRSSRERATDAAQPTEPVRSSSAALAPTPQFLAVWPIADRLFVLQGVETDTSLTQHLTAEAPDATSTRPLDSPTPLNQGNFLIVQDRGPAQRASYTLASADGACRVTSKRTVALQLDSGEPEQDSALGPVWLADEVSGCGIALQSGLPSIAVPGREIMTAERAPAATAASMDQGLPRRVMLNPATQDCDGSGGEFVEAILEVAGHKYALLRSSDSIDWIAVRPLARRTHERPLGINASLYWDQQVDAC